MCNVGIGEWPSVGGRIIVPCFISNSNVYDVKRALLCSEACPMNGLLNVICVVWVCVFNAFPFKVKGSTDGPKDLS